MKCKKIETDKNGNITYYRNGDGSSAKFEYNKFGKCTYHETSDGYWEKWEYDKNGKRTYYENSNGYKVGQSREVTQKRPESIKEKIARLSENRPNLSAKIHNEIEL